MNEFKYVLLVKISNFILLEVTEYKTFKETEKYQ